MAKIVAAGRKYAMKNKWRLREGAGSTWHPGLNCGVLVKTKALWER
jgi:hypothetical protein